jgi:sortase (surface protein transpeptidase)
MFTRRSLLGCLVTVLVIAAVLAGCENKEMREALAGPPPSPTLLPSVQPTIKLTVHPLVQPPVLPPVQPTPTPFVLGPLFDADLDIKAGPIDVPLELQIPALQVNAPVIGVGLSSENVMDAPKGPIDDPVWHTAFWYRGSGIPGESGTATISAHVNDPLGRPEIFADLQDLQPGDLIIVHYTKLNIDIHFIVDQIKVYSIQESSDPAVLTLIYGAGPVAGTGPQPALDGLSHLTLITCAGNIVNGQFDHHTVVYATRSP